MPTVAGTSQIIFVEVGTGSASVDYGIVLGFVDGENDLDEGEGTLTVFVQGAGPLEDVTFAVYDGSDWIEISVQPADENGNVGPLDLFIPDVGVSPTLVLRATTTAGSTAEANIAVPAGAGGTADPGLDAAPVLIADSEGRWVLQDLMPGGIGSWVMPINPTSMSNPHVVKVANARHTTAVNTGKYSVSEASPGALPWTLAGYVPNQTFHDKLTAYADLNRRIYVIDHRGRAWKCVVTALEITPRKRQLEDDGAPQDWAGNYRLGLNITEPEFLTPA